MSKKSQKTPQVLKPVQLLNYCGKTLTATPYDVKWVPCSAKCVVLGQNPRGTGCIQIYELDNATLKTLKESEKTNAIKCGTFGASFLETRHIAVGDFNGNMSIYDLDDLTVPLYHTKGHKEIINCIDGVGGLNIGHGAPEIATGSRDGTVCVWDPRTTKPVASLTPAEGERVVDCWAVAFGNSFDDANRSLAAGYENGDIKLYDLRMNKIVWEENVSNGICGLSFDRKDITMNKLLVATLEAKMRVYDMRTHNPRSGYCHLNQVAHGSTIWLTKPLPQNREVFMSCGGNGTLCLWKYVYPPNRSVSDGNDLMGVPGTLEFLNDFELGTQPIVGFDWHLDKSGLFAAVALDQSVRIGFATNLNTL